MTGILVSADLPQAHIRAMVVDLPLQAQFPMHTSIRCQSPSEQPVKPCFSFVGKSSAESRSSLFIAIG
jgi:hypothetical protein